MEENECVVSGARIYGNEDPNIHDGGTYSPSTPVWLSLRSTSLSKNMDGAAFEEANQ